MKNKLILIIAFLIVFPIVNAIDYTKYNYTAFNFGITYDASPAGITWNGSSFFVSGTVLARIAEYNKTGGFTGYNFSSNAQDTAPVGITWNGSSFFAVGSVTDKVYEYNKTGGYTGFSFSVATEEGTPTGITWNGSSFFVSGNDNNMIYEYNKTGGFTGFNFSVTDKSTAPAGVTWGAGSFFILDASTNFNIYEYNKTGGFTGYNFSIATQVADPGDLVWINNEFFVADNSADAVFKYASFEFPAWFNNQTSASVDLYTHYTVQINLTLNSTIGLSWVFIAHNDSNGVFRNISNWSISGTEYKMVYNWTVYSGGNKQWQITFNGTNGFWNQTPKFSFEVNKIFIDNCSLVGTATLNITIKNETNNAVIPTTINYVFTYWPTHYENDISNYSNTITASNETFCIYPNWTSVTSNILFEYYQTGGTIFDYSTYQLTLTNVTKSLNLYLQDGTTQVLFTVQDINSDPLIDAYIHILKYDISTNSYKVVEILKTDSQGQTLGNIVLGTVFYNFLIYYQGNLVYNEQAVKLITNTRTFTINLAGTNWFDNFKTTLGVATDLYFNNITNNFVYTWTDPTSAMHYGCMRVDKSNRTGKFLLNDSCLETASGTLLYNIPSLKNGTTYTATGYLKFDFEIITDVVNKVMPAIYHFYTVSPFMSLFIAAIFCMVLFFMGMPNPSLSLSLLGFSVIFSSLLGLWYISILQVASIIFLILVQLYMNRS